MESDCNHNSLFSFYLGSLHEMLYVKPMFKAMRDLHQEESIIGLTVRFIN